jgi:hypothetical protein
MIRIEMLEFRRLLDGTLPPPDGNPPPDNLVGNLGGGRSPIMVTMSDPNEISDPNTRLLTPGGKIVLLPAATLPGILKAMDDPNH